MTNLIKKEMWSYYIECHLTATWEEEIYYCPELQITKTQLTLSKTIRQNQIKCIFLNKINENKTYKISDLDSN